MAEGIASSWRSLARMHAYAYYVLRSTFKTVWNDGLDEWKALVIMSVAMGFTGLTVVSVVSICFQRRVFLPQSKAEFLTLWGVVGLSAVILNYYTLVSGRKWSHLETEIKCRSKISRICTSVAVWVSLVILVAASEWTGSIAWKLPP